MDGLIAKGVGGFYYVIDEGGRTHTLRAQGKLRRQRITPLVGDRVSFEAGEGEAHGWLNAVRERKNSLIRPPVANIDRLVITLAAVKPSPDLLLADRLLMLCRLSGIEPVLAINKRDQDGRAAEELAAEYAGAGAHIAMVSAEDGGGVDELRALLRGTVHAFGGQSGVGKSTLINALYGLTLSTGDLSDKTERGKHTTRHTELIAVEGGGMVLDTPGFSLLELDLAPPLTLKDLYPEFAPYEGLCRFSPCAHVEEPDCAVCRAAREGLIARARYERYAELYETMNERWRERYD